MPKFDSNTPQGKSGNRGSVQSKGNPAAAGKPSGGRAQKPSSGKPLAGKLQLQERSCRLNPADRAALPDSHESRVESLLRQVRRDRGDLRPGDRIAVTIKRIGINGEGVGYYKRKAVFIRGALPDEVVKALVTRIEPGFLHAELVQVEKKNPLTAKKAGLPGLRHLRGLPAAAYVLPGAARGQGRDRQRGFSAIHEAGAGAPPSYPRHGRAVAIPQ